MADGFKHFLQNVLKSYLEGQPLDVMIENIFNDIVLFLSLIRPAYGGRDCPGSAFDYQMCNTEECAGTYEDFRAQQCIQRSNKYHKNIKHTWLPYEHPDGKSVRSEAKLAPSFRG